MSKKVVTLIVLSIAAIAIMIGTAAPILLKATSNNNETRTSVKKNIEKEPSNTQEPAKDPEPIGFDYDNAKPIYATFNPALGVFDITFPFDFYSYNVTFFAPDKVTEIKIMFVYLPFGYVIEDWQSFDGKIYLVNSGVSYILYL